MYATVNPAKTAIEGAHTIYHGRHIRLTSLPNECQIVDLVWKDDGPNCEARSNPDIPDRFFVFGNPSDPGYCSWLRTELFYRVERLRKFHSGRLVEINERIHP